MANFLTKSLVKTVIMMTNDDDNDDMMIISLRLLLRTANSDNNNNNFNLLPTVSYPAYVKILLHSYIITHILMSPVSE